MCLFFATSGSLEYNEAMIVDKESEKFLTPHVRTNHRSFFHWQQNIKLYHGIGVDFNKAGASVVKTDKPISQ
jgi:hypothetical protein